MQTPQPHDEPTAPRRRRGVVRTVVVVAAVCLSAPLVIALWIGGILGARELGIAVSANQVFAWILAGLVALLLWPLLQRRTARESWRAEHGEPLPQRRPTPMDAAARVVVRVIGTVALIAICGPQDIAGALSSLRNVAAPGYASSAALLQLVALVLGVVLLPPAMLVTGRALDRTPRDAPRYLDLQLRQNWYAAAAMSWAGALIIGILFAWLVLAVL